MARARHLMRLVVAANARTPYAGVLREHFERVLQHPDPLLYHDDLAEVNTPVYLHEFVAHAARHGLQFLAEARLHDSQLHELPEEVAAELGRLPDDAVVREQYIDFVVNRMFRQTLLCRDDMALDRNLDARRLAGLSFAAPLARRAARRRAAHVRRPRGRQLPARTTAAERRGRGDRRRLAAGRGLRAARRRASTRPPATASAASCWRSTPPGSLDLHTHPPAPAAVPGARPVASPLALRQAVAGLDRVTSLRHASVRLEDPLAAHLLSLLDGSRDRDDLEAAIRRVRRRRRPRRDRRRAAGDLAVALDAALARLAELSLLVA